MNEIFKDVKGYEGLYEVSNYGNVRSLYTNKILKPATKKRGYQYVNLYKNKKGKMYQVHRLVAESFIPNTNNLPIINHKDENSQNNNVDNLEWCTYKYNSNYGSSREKIRKSRLGKNFGYIGEKAPMYGKKHTEETKTKIKIATTGKNNHMYGKKHTEESKYKISNKNKGKFKGKNNPSARKVLCITTGEIFNCATEASEKYNLNHSALCKCCKGVTKTCNKMEWTYI